MAACKRLDFGRGDLELFMGFVMKTLFKTFAVLLLLLTTASMASAQEGPSRMELDCLAFTTASNGIAMPGAAARMPSFHHVWTPGVRYHYFESKGRKFFFETEGHGRETILVIHGGAGLPHEYFHPMLSNLSRFAKMVYFDRRADMLSASKPTEMATVAEQADDLDALRQKLGLDRVTLLAHSFGGAIALNYALRYPDHVKRLILVSTAASVENPDEAEKRVMSKLSPADRARYKSNEGESGGNNPCERVRRRYALLYPHYFSRPTPYEFDRGVYIAYFDALTKKFALSQEPGEVEFRAELSEIQAPALVVAGRNDLVTPLEQATELASGLPKSRLVVMNHSGHFPFFEENYLFTEWVRQFLIETNDHRNDFKVGGPVISSTGNSR